MPPMTLKDQIAALTRRLDAQAEALKVSRALLTTGSTAPAETRLPALVDLVCEARPDLTPAAAAALVIDTTPGLYASYVRATEARI